MKINKVNKLRPIFCKSYQYLKKEIKIIYRTDKDADKLKAPDFVNTGIVEAAT